MRQKSRLLSADSISTSPFFPLEKKPKKKKKKKREHTGPYNGEHSNWVPDRIGTEERDCVAGFQAVVLD